MGRFTRRFPDLQGKDDNCLSVFIFAHIPSKDMICYLVYDFKLIKISCGCSCNCLQDVYILTARPAFPPNSPNLVTLHLHGAGVCVGQHTGALSSTAGAGAGAGAGGGLQVGPQAALPGGSPVAAPERQVRHVETAAAACS